MSGFLKPFDVSSRLHLVNDLDHALIGDAQALRKLAEMERAARERAKDVAVSAAEVVVAALGESDVELRFEAFEREPEQEAEVGGGGHLVNQGL